ncbi:flagellar FliL protein [Rhodopseudomonas thermotolerans]|jgi:flagellar FliL protein|uniref:Flagellar protein FliL n=2 Tax=Rhodopseudomonas TaxID=1073 RepID=A0A336JKD3_9BRAD|nr:MULTISPECIES: flagellar basal body-associated protein FliL [Rhodopseudomonas]RED38145.1 flagellar FliL protein [Rhodopseudomonas pentothenatexigens]REG05338.1 flagellar FliL protein [Rhodopseudomonas thermotolerans]SSW90170.1 flagellar FliL protein [Rhodopseudomonas pentothenatexigens]
MADAEKPEEGADAGEGGAPKSKKKLIIIIAAAALLLIGGGGGGWFFLMRGHDDKDKDHHAEAAKAVKPPSFVEVPEIMVNLAGTPGERVQYLKAKVVLEVKDEKLVEQIKPNMPRITDLFQTYLRELRSGDLNGSVGMFRMKEELTRRVNMAIAPAQVSAVLFKEVLVQ